MSAMEAVASTRRQGAFVAGQVMLCAWCARYGQPHGAARDCAGGEWRAISHERARTLDRSSGTSHGICPWCRPRFAAEWDLDDSPALAAPVPAALASLPLAG
jgi:hypothetical protein